MAEPFMPVLGGTVLIDVSASSGAVNLGRGANVSECLVFNDGTATVWFTFGLSTATASLTTSIPISTKAWASFRIPRIEGGNIYAAAIAAGSTGKIYFTPGIGN
jgi:predicted metal-binding membrane protein